MLDPHNTCVNFSMAVSTHAVALCQLRFNLFVVMESGDKTSNGKLFLIRVTVVGVQTTRFGLAAILATVFVKLFEQSVFLLLPVFLLAFVDLFTKLRIVCPTVTLVLTMICSTFLGVFECHKVSRVKREGWESNPRRFLRRSCFQDSVLVHAGPNP